jgi:hypothetical protein
VARYDKYDPFDGGFRAALAALIAVGNVEKLLAVSLDANGKVVVGAQGQTGFRGLLVVNGLRNAGDIVDVMQDGECVECAGLAAGTNYFVDGTSGLIVAGTGANTSTAPVAAGSKYIGHTVEATRMVVRVARP